MKRIDNNDKAGEKDGSGDEEESDVD